MKYNTCLIKQPAGLGDIFFCQKIAKSIIDRYDCDVIWPVISQFKFVSEYLHHDRIWYVDVNEHFPYKQLYMSEFTGLNQHEDVLCVPLQIADQCYPQVRILDSKYKLVNLDFDDWDTYFTFNRNCAKENILFRKVLGLSESDSYSVVNTEYGSPPGSKHITNIRNCKYKKVDIKTIVGYNPIDWCKVLENASEINTVDTCFTFLLEKIELKTDDINLYLRPPNPHVPTWRYETKHVFKKKYNLIHD